MKILGIDTDTKGSVALFDTSDNSLIVFALPNKHKIINKTKRLRLDEAKTKEILTKLVPRADAIFLEQQNARPQQGVTSTFTFGQVYGTLIGLTHGCGGEEDTIHFVTGAKWKNSLGVTRDKKATVNFADRLAPECSHVWKLVKHTSAAEAFLIALYGAGSLGISITRKPITPTTITINNMKSLS